MTLRKRYSAVLPQVMLTQEQKERLYAYVERYNLSISDVVREALDEHLERETMTEEQPTK